MKLIVRYAVLSVFLVLFTAVLFNMNFWLQLPVTASSKRYKREPVKKQEPAVPDLDPNGIYLFRNIKIPDRDELKNIIQQMQVNNSAEFTKFSHIHDNWLNDAKATKYQNPCWKNDNNLDCLPYAILGGFPKCGTTDFYTSILIHPVVLKGSKKGFNWWTHDRFNMSSFGDYIDNFRDAASRVGSSVNSEGEHNKIIIEGSTHTVWDNSRLFKDYQTPDYLNLHVIKKLLPDTKFILITRNPAQRLYSDYLSTHSNASSDEFNKLTVRSLNLLQDCLRHSRATFLYCVYAHLDGAPKLYPRILLGLYSVHITILQTIFSPEQIFVTQLEDYKNNRTQVLGQVTKFLEIPNFTPRALREVISRDKVMFDDKYYNQGIERMKYLTYETLMDFYKPFDQQLEEIIAEQNKRLGYTNIK